MVKGEILKLSGAAELSHGLYRHLSLSTDQWPEPMREAYNTRVLMLTALDHIDPQLDGGLCSQVARHEVLLDSVWKHLGEHGFIDKNGVPAPILTMLSVYENALTRLYSRAGLTPEARKKMGIAGGRVSWARRLASVDVTGKKRGAKRG